MNKKDCDMRKANRQTFVEAMVLPASAILLNKKSSVIRFLLARSYNAMEQKNGWVNSFTLMLMDPQFT